MALTLQTRHILPMLAERGLKVHRESLAEMSDLLGLRTRPKVGNQVQRSWRPAEVELIAIAFLLRQRWQLGDDDLRALLVDDGGAYADSVVRQLENLLGDFARRLAAAREETRRWEADGHPDLVDAGAECTTAA